MDYSPKPILGGEGHKNYKHITLSALTKHAQFECGWFLCNVCVVQSYQ